ncbi:MAG TPA: FAD-dependent oxidoreductase [Gemmatimonadaceae bacterium]|nr:FAD-dependent oxidoreductase [Gemmatimonadaceae bacterium]
MARSPLFSLVRRSLQLASESGRRDVPADEIGQLERERSMISRRRFVATTATAAAAVALEGCGIRRLPAPISGMEPVLIIGGGIAGLTAGYRLRQAGIPVRIIEAQQRSGGRMHSLRGFFADGQVCELGGELIDSNHQQVRALATELGIEIDDLAGDDPALDSDVWYFGGARRSDREVVEAFTPIASRIREDLATLGGDGSVGYREPNGGEALDRMSIAEWLDRAGARGWIRDLLDVAYTTEYGLEIEQQSSLNLLLMIDPAPEPFRIFGESDERFHVRGGNDRIVRTLADRLGDAIELDTRLEALSARPDGTFVCSLRRGETSFDATAGHVLLAIPFTLLRDVRLNVDLPPVKRRAIAELGYGTSAKLMVGFSQRAWRTAHRSNGSVLSDLPFQLCWETSRLQRGSSGILTNFTGGAHGVELGQGTAAEQASAFVQQLERPFAGVTATRAGMREVRAHWPSHPFTRGSYASYLVGQWTGISGAEGERVGRLLFAGEHCSLEAQGFMEGGCETGQSAAAEILRDLGVQRDASRRTLLRSAMARGSRGVRTRSMRALA